MAVHRTSYDFHAKEEADLWIEGSLNLYCQCFYKGLGLSSGRWTSEELAGESKIATGEVARMKLSAISNPQNFD